MNDTSSFNIPIINYSIYNFNFNKQTVTDNNGSAKICFCSGYSKEVFCDECYWPTNEIVKHQSNSYYNYNHNIQNTNNNNIDNNNNNTINNNNNIDNNNSTYQQKKQQLQKSLEMNSDKKKYRKSAEICFCSGHSKEIFCAECYWPSNEIINEEIENDQSIISIDFNSPSNTLIL